MGDNMLVEVIVNYLINLIFVLSMDNIDWMERNETNKKVLRPAANLEIERHTLFIKHFLNSFVININCYEIVCFVFCWTNKNFYSYLEYLYSSFNPL